jgi:hypothetical protein
MCRLTWSVALVGARAVRRVQAAAQHGWKAYLTTDEDEPAEAIVYCPECDEGVRGMDRA